MLGGSPRSMLSSIIRPGNQIPPGLSGSKRELYAAVKVSSDSVASHCVECVLYTHVCLDFFLNAWPFDSFSSYQYLLKVKQVSCLDSIQTY